MVQHPAWIEFFKSIRPAFQLPSRKTISTSYLNNAYEEMQVDIAVKLNEASTLHLQLDGWSNLRNEGIINFIVTKPEPYFVNFVNTKDNRHTAEYLKSEIINVLNNYQPLKFFSIIGDNAANIQKAFKLIKDEYPDIQTFGCAAHTLHLLCQDILNVESVKNLEIKCKSVIKTIKYSQIYSSTLKKHADEQNIKISLKLPVKTRWGSFLFSLQSLQKNKSALQAFAVDYTIQSLPRDIKLLILDDDEFWPNINELINVLKPVINGLLFLETDQTVIHKVIEVLYNIESTFTFGRLSDTLFNCSEDIYIQQKFNSRKNMILNNIHLAAHLLDPSKQGQYLSNPQKIDALEFINSVAETMNINENVMTDLANYQSHKGIFSKVFLWKNIDKIEPLKWWKLLGQCTSLSTVAVKILTTPATSAATERSFSTFSWIHSKKT